MEPQYFCHFKSFSHMYITSGFSFPSLPFFPKGRENSLNKSQPWVRVQTLRWLFSWSILPSKIRKGADWSPKQALWCLKHQSLWQSPRNPMWRASYKARKGKVTVKTERGAVSKNIRRKPLLFISPSPHFKLAPSLLTISKSITNPDTFQSINRHQIWKVKEIFTSPLSQLPKEL